MAQQEREQARGRAIAGRLDRIFTVVTLALGGWLVAAPFVLDYRDETDGIGGTTNDVIVGVIVVILSTTRLLVPLPTPPLSLVMAALGVWLIVAPFALRYAVDGGWPAAKTNDIVVGVAVILAATAAWLLGAWRADTERLLLQARAADPAGRTRVR